MGSGPAPYDNNLHTLDCGGVKRRKTSGKRFVTYAPAPPTGSARRFVHPFCALSVVSVSTAAQSPPPSWPIWDGAWPIHGED